ncbi:hypothetical protein QTN25_010858 [Entamoeba marina]
MDNNPQTFTQETYDYQPPAVPIELCSEPSGCDQQDFHQPQMGTPQYCESENPVQVQQVESTDEVQQGCFKSKKKEMKVMIMLMILSLFFGFILGIPCLISMMIGLSSPHKKAKILGFVSCLLFPLGFFGVFIIFSVSMSIGMTRNF